MGEAVELEQVEFEGCRLVLGVARLGDRDLRGWWKSSAMDVEVGQFVLANTFPRTGRIAGAELLLLSAARRHQQVLDRPNALHLFSEQLMFHRWTKAWLGEQKMGVAADVIGELESWSDTDVASNALRRWVARDAPSGESVFGAVNLGRIQAGELADRTFLLHVARMMAACYVEMVDFVPPYFNVGSK
jgi:hypothetical protein